MSETVDIPDPDLAIGEVTEVDDDGNTLTATFPVTVGQTDDYLIGIELRDQDGQVVSDAVAAVEDLSDDGEQQVALALEREAVQRAVLDGASQLTFGPATVSRGDHLVTVGLLPGPFGDFDLSALLEPQNALFGSLSGEVVDDRLRYEVPVYQPAGSQQDLLVEGQLLAPGSRHRWHLRPPGRR